VPKFQFTLLTEGRLFRLIHSCVFTSFVSPYVMKTSKGWAVYHQSKILCFSQHLHFLPTTLTNMLKGVKDDCQLCIIITPMNVNVLHR